QRRLPAVPACLGRRFSLRHDLTGNARQGANVAPPVPEHAHSPDAPGSWTIALRSIPETTRSGTRWQACRAPRRPKIRTARCPEAGAPTRLLLHARRAIPESPNCGLGRARAIQAWRIDSQAVPQVAPSCQSSSGRFRPPILPSTFRCGLQFGALIWVDPAFFASSAPALQVGCNEL